MPTLTRKYLYKVYRDGLFIGQLQNVTSEFSYSQTINTAGTELTIEMALNADVANQAVVPLTDENGNNITDESGNIIYIDRQPDVVGVDTAALVRNNNDVKVYEISDDDPNGQIVFSGYISRWRAGFYNGNDIVSVNCLSHGSELDNYLIAGTTAVDVSQAVQNSSYFIYEPSLGASFARVGQTFVVGVGVTQLDGIRVKLDTGGVSQSVELRLYTSVAAANAGNAPLATVTRSLNASVATDYDFTFAVPPEVTPGATLFFALYSLYDSGSDIYYQSTSVYAGGTRYSVNYGGGGGSASFTVDTGDLYFETYYTTGATSVPFSNYDPSNIVREIVDAYAAQGGTIDYDDAISTIDDTGLTVSYTFKVNTVLEGIRKAFDLSPATWYWYVDPATSLLYFKQASTIAQHKFVLGNDIEGLDVVATVEEVKNNVYFTGGDTGSGENLFINVSDSASIADNAGRVGLDRITDNRVTQQDTGEAIANAHLDSRSDQMFETSVVINAEKYDVNTVDLGDTVGFAGFGNFVDSLLLQVVEKTKYAANVELKLGVIPKRFTANLEDALRRLNEVETVDNPSVPS